MKSQAEAAGRLVNAGGVHPQSGTVLRDVEVTMADGTRRLLSSLRGNSSLVMVFTGGRRVSNLLTPLAGREAILNENNARVLVIATARDQLVANSELQGKVFLLAIDDNKGVHGTLGATDAAQNPVPAIYITDRFGEVFAAFQSENPSLLPNAEEIIRWVEFVSYQCEECSPPEWQE
jgi:peroxiredoxin